MKSIRSEIAELRDEVEKLQAKIRELEARPVYVPYPVYVPQQPVPVYVSPYVVPYAPPVMPCYTITCGGNGAPSGSGGIISG